MLSELKEYFNIGPNALARAEAVTFSSMNHSQILYGPDLDETFDAADGVGHAFLSL